MKLIYRILIRLSFALIVILTIWGFLFYIAMIDEINDEVDDTLENYSENIITRALAGQDLPLHSDGTNNSYYLTEISKDYVDHTQQIRYSDEMVYIRTKEETEPARVLKTIFKNTEGRYFELTVSIPTIEKEDLQEAILNWMVLLYVTLLLIVLGINIWVFHHNMRPFYVLLEWLDQYTIGKEIPLPALKTNITEFKKMHEAALHSAKRNQIIFEQQKQFIGNASHELQTPLAICQNRLEMLAEEESLTEGQLAGITKIQQTLSYIIRLNKSLLFLSKIDNGQFQDSKETSLNELVRQQIEDYQEIYSYKNITIEIEDNEQLKISMNETLATALISNLLKNAYVHNISQGKIRILISAKGLIFCNTGISTALDEQQIFQRFYQGENSGQNSSGLGLAIAESICKLYHIRLRYFYSEAHHFELSI